MKKKVRKEKRVDKPALDERKAILDERHDLQKLFPAAYSPQIAIFNPNRVEVMLTVSRQQAENLARLLRENKL